MAGITFGSRSIGAVCAAALLVGVLGAVGIAPAGAAATVTGITTVHTNALSGVSCGSAAFCEAYAGGSASAGALVAITNGTPGTPQNVTGSVVAVSCAPGTTSCVALQFVQQTNQVNNNTNVIPITNGVLGTATATALGTQLNGVACVSATQCIAAGEQNGKGGVIIPITNGVPGAPTGTPVPATLLGISCGSATSCVAVGDTLDASGYEGAVVAVANGVAGKVQVPSGLGGAGGSVLDNVSCSDATNCVAVGNDDNAGADTALVVAITGGVPGAKQDPAGTSTSPATAFGPNPWSVSCVSGTCDAVTPGQLQTSVSAGTASLLVPVTSGTAGAGQALGTGAEAFYGLACLSASDCVGVGGQATGLAFTATVSPTGGPPPPPACTAQPASPAPTGLVTRRAGSDRDATSVVVSQATFPTAGSAQAVVLASDANYPDALAGTPLAVAKHAPLLLTTPTGLPTSVSAEISRVAPKGATVYLLGGTAALASTIDPQVTALGDTPQRIAGPDRFGTAVAIAGVLGDPKTILEATGFAFPDALGAGAAAAKATGAVLLTNGSSQASETAAYLAAHTGDTAFAVGGPAATAAPSATPLVGSDRYATSVLVAQHFFTAPTTLGFASGLAFPDALSGGANIGAAGGPILLVPVCGSLPSSLTSYLGSTKASVTGGSLYGGAFAVGDDVLATLEQAA